jgi:hypothetical protein
VGTAPIHYNGTLSNALRLFSLGHGFVEIKGVENSCIDFPKQVAQFKAKDFTKETKQ